MRGTYSLGVALSIPISIALAFFGLLAGALLAPFFSANTFFPVIVIPIALNIAMGYFLITSKLNANAGQVFLIGGTIASIALPLILL